MKSIFEYLLDPKRNVNRESRKWYCSRAKRIVLGSMCKLCHECGATTFNFRKHSEETPETVRNGKHWTKEPCLYECGYDVDREEEDFLTIEESIKNNFWSNLEDR